MNEGGRMSDRDLIERYFAAMRQGAAGAEELLALFAPDAVYIEPFTDEDPAVGIEAIEQRFRTGWEFPLPDVELDVFELSVDGPTATARWECRSPGLPGPVRGNDRYELTDGLISRLEVTIEERR